MDFEKHFTLEEAQSLLPVLESLLKRAVEARRAAEVLEQEQQELSRKVFLSGGMFFDVRQLRTRRAAYEAEAHRIKDSLAEIEAIGVQVKDLDTGLLDFPCLIGGETVLLCWKMGESRIEFWHTLEAGFAGRQPVDARFTNKTGRRRDPPN